jgi:hypothetical protein
MNMEIGNEAEQFHFWKHINQILFAVQCVCSCRYVCASWFSRTHFAMRDQPSSWLKPRGAMPTQSTKLVETIKSKKLVQTIQSRKLVQTIKAAKLGQITLMEKVGFHSNLRECYILVILKRAEGLFWMGTDTP